MHQLSLIFPILVLATACGDVNTQIQHENNQPPVLGSGENSLAGVCKMDLVSRPRPLYLFDTTVSAGGRSCYHNKKVEVFLPTTSGCHGLLSDHLVYVAFLSERAAESEFSECTALREEPNEDFGKAITFQTETSKQRRNDSQINEFSTNIRAMITNDGLEVTFYSNKFGIICMETDRPDQVLNQIKHSGINFPSEVETAVLNSPCSVIFEERNLALVAP